MRAILLATFLCLVFIIDESMSVMTEKQMKATLRLVRNTCQPKYKATNEQVDGMQKGEWEQDKNGQCYLYCILNSYKLIRKDNSFDWEGGIKTIESLMPSNRAVPAVASVRNCKDAVKTKDDKCAVGYEIARCIYYDNPENYFFP